MERLWSPWRSKYIDSFNNENENTGCIFCNCEAVDVNDNSNLIVYKDKLSFVVLNLYPYNSGHLLVVPYRHTDDFNSFSDEENLEIMKNLQLTQNILTKVMKPHGFNVGANLGRAAGAGIDQHIHFHIVPRWTGDINFMPALGEVKIISQDLLDTKKRLVEEFNLIVKSK
ncbi:MAG: HIT domain-containing protein [Ignavibacteriales bacterium]|nr:MAG: HIT domain-containing protein [Ignavibacteriales bacterium]